MVTACSLVPRARVYSRVLFLCFLGLVAVHDHDEGGSSNHEENRWEE